MRKAGLLEAARRPARWQVLAVAAVMALVAAPGSSSGWSQQAELTATHGASLDYFGSAVAVSGSTAVVGAYGTKAGTGAAYVFVRSGSVWRRQAELTAPHGTQGDNFGASVAVSGSTAVVGAYGTKSDRGEAYVYVRSGSSWSRKAELTVPRAAKGDNFGSSVAVSGSTVVVGADGRNSETGAAYVYVRSGTSWPRKAELTPKAGTDFLGGFGNSVAISGSTVVVGAVANDSNHGSAYVFVHSSKAWSQRAELTDPGNHRFDNFGVSVAISGSTVVVGANGSALNSGAAYVYVRSGKAWPRQASLPPAGTAFGVSVGISGSTAIVGTDGAAFPHPGAAYVFVRSGKSWSKRAKLVPSDGGSAENFGDSVAISGSTAVAGDPDHASLAGSAYAFVGG